MSSASSDPFRSNLSLGLHAAAQPLAILRSWFDPIYNTEMTDVELREMVSGSTEHVDRLCTLFGYLQQLVAAENMTPKLTITPIEPLLADITEGVELWFENMAMKLVSDISTESGSALADTNKLRQAVSTVLMLAQNLSSEGDQIELSSRPSGESIQIVVKNQRSFLETLEPETELGLAAAEATIHNQHGRFTYSLQPLTIKIDLPKIPSTK